MIHLTFKLLLLLSTLQTISIRAKRMKPRDMTLVWNMTLKSQTWLKCLNYSSCMSAHSSRNDLLSITLYNGTPLGNIFLLLKFNMGFYLIMIINFRMEVKTTQLWWNTCLIISLRNRHKSLCHSLSDIFFLVKQLWST